MQRLRRLFCIAICRIDRRWQILKIAYLVAFCLLMPAVASAQLSEADATPALLDNMDGRSPLLTLGEAGSGFQFGQRAIDRKTFRHGSGAERIALRGPAGRAAQLVYQLPPTPVIQELKIKADLIVNRGGVRLAARVVLPRTSNLSTGQPYELLVRGAEVAAGRNWEQLSLDNLPQRLANHARVARAQYRTALDERGAYVSQLVFLTPGGPGTTELIVDRIRVFGVVNSQPRVASNTGVGPATFQKPGKPSLSTNPHQAPKTDYREVRIPRIIQWQGEAFDFLQKLGFNTIGMDRLPTDEELEQIEHLGLAVFCPPPAPDALTEKTITAQHNSVLAWNLGEQFSTEDLAQVEQWERLVARHDPIVARPTVLAPQLNTLEASRTADVMLVGRAVVGTELTIREHTAWLAQRQYLARPGTPTWTKIETQPSRSQRLQMAALSSPGQSPQTVSYQQLTALTSAGLGIKTRGFYFESEASLQTEDLTTQRRALAVEIANLRVQLAEPWLIAGKEVSSARSSQPDLSALVMQAERSHLLVPVWWTHEMSSLVHPRQSGPVSFVVPGVAESSEAFLVTLGGMQRVRHRRVTGGIRVSLEELPADGFILLSDDQQAIAQITRYLRTVAPRAVKIRRDLASLRLQDAAGLATRLAVNSSDGNQSQALLSQAKVELDACDQQLKLQSYAFAYLRADAVDLALDEVFGEVIAKLGGGKALGTATLHHVSISLPDRMQLQRTLARAPLSSNLLSGGGFENLSALLENGWRHKQLQLDGITTSVRLSPEAPHSGSYCLELEARALDESAPMTIVPTAPVWISSTPLQVRKGDLLEITGVARLPEPLVGSVDGLQIIDSLGGTDMALRIHEAPTWHPFRVVRAVTSDSQVSVTIALSGLGKAQIDDVAVRVVQRR